MNLRPLAPQASIIAKLDDGPADRAQRDKLLNHWAGRRRMGNGEGIATCSVCGRISASGGDHLDCGEMRRARLEDERIGAAARRELLAPGAGGGRGGDGDLAVEMRAVLDHIGGGDGAGQGPARRPSAPGRWAGREPR